VYAFTLQQVIADAAERDPAEARRELQRLFPNDYAPPAVRQQISGPDGGAVVTEIVIRYADDNDTPAAPRAATDTPERPAL
jgi:hypothetical protein